MKYRVVASGVLALFVAACGGDTRITSPTATVRVPHPVSAVGVDSVTGARIETDLDDYSPGQTVHVVGTGWAAGETVNLTLVENPDTHDDLVQSVQANDAGAFSLDLYVIQSSDLGAVLTLTATGQTSGSAAVATFTDGTISLGSLETRDGASCSSPQGSVTAGTPICAHSSFTISGGGATAVQIRWKSPAGSIVQISQRSPDFPNPTSGIQTYDATYTPTAAGTWTVLLCEGNNTDLAPSGVAGCQSGRERASQTFQVTAAPSNTAPLLDAIGSKTVNELAELTFTATATDDGKPNPPAALSYALASPASGTFPTGAAISTSGVFTWTPTEVQGPGTYRVKVVVSDDALSDEEEIEITVNEVNVAPILAAIGDKNVNEGTLLSFTATATDADLPANALTFSLQGTVPTGAQITSAGAFTWTPTESQGPGTYPITIRVTDNGTGNLFHEETISVQVAEVATAPVLDPIGDKEIDEGSPLSFTATATDPDGDALTFSLQGTVPSGAAITAGGAFTWTPTEAQGPGTYPITIRVTDNGAGNLFDEETINVKVNEVNVAPVLNAIGNKTINEETLLSFAATASDADLPANTLTFSLQGTVPGGAAITTGGAFTWTPTEAQGPGDYSVTIRVTDNGSPNLYDEETINIHVDEVNVAPAFSTAPTNVPATPWGVSIANQSIKATDADLPKNTLTFSKVSGPSWVSVTGSGVSEASGTISFGATTAADVGVHTVVVQVSDGALSAQASFTVEIAVHDVTVAYTGKTAGQYSDKSTLSATLTDNVTSSPLSGKTIVFTFAGGAAGSDVTDVDGKADVLYQVLSAAPGPYAVKASFAGGSGYGSDDDTKNFSVSKENAAFASVAFNGSVPVSTTTIQVTFGVQELRVSGAEPTPNDGAMPGNVALVDGITAKMTGISANSSYTGSCGTGSGGTTDYTSTRAFTCNFTGPFTVDAYTLTLDIPTTNLYWAATTFEDALSVWDPNAGFATGGGTFNLDGERVSFGFSYTASNGKQGPRSGFVVVRHLAGGGVCRVKSNNQMNIPAVNGKTVTLSGKGNYVCTDALGVTTASAGNVNIAAYAEDNATSGIGQDRFWVSNTAAYSPNALAMPGPAGDPTKNKLLTGGNVQVPQPGR